TDAAIIAVMDKNRNMCRCGTYPRIVAALKSDRGPRAGAGAFNAAAALVWPAGGDRGEAAAPSASEWGWGSTSDEKDQAAQPRRDDLAQDAFSGVEDERYELFEGPRYRFELDRRGFVKTFSAGLLVLLVTSRRGAAQESGRGFRAGDRMPSDVGAWLHIADDGAVTVFTGKTEIGQNIRTSLTQAVA